MSYPGGGYDVSRLAAGGDLHGGSVQAFGRGLGGLVDRKVSGDTMHVFVRFPFGFVFCVNAALVNGPQADEPPRTSHSPPTITIVECFMRWCVRMQGVSRDLRMQRPPDDVILHQHPGVCMTSIVVFSRTMATIKSVDLRFRGPSACLPSCLSGSLFVSLSLSPSRGCGFCLFCEFVVHVPRI